MTEIDTPSKIKIFLQGLGEQQAAVEDLGRQIEKMLSEQSEFFSSEYGKRLDVINQAAQQEIKNTETKRYELFQENERLKEIIATRDQEIDNFAENSREKIGKSEA